VVYRICDQLGPIRYSEPTEQSKEVILYRVDTKVEASCDISIREPGSDKLKYFPLALSQVVIARSPRLDQQALQACQPLEDVVQVLVTAPDLSFGNRLDTTLQCFQRVITVYHASGSSSKSIHHNLFGAFAVKEQHCAYLGQRRMAESDDIFGLDIHTAPLGTDQYNLWLLLF